VARAWDLDALDDRYRMFNYTFARYRVKWPRSTVGDRGAFIVRTHLIHIFRQFAELDPELPDDIIHGPGQRTQAVDLFHELYGILAAPTQRYFDRATAEGKSAAAIAR
jgi:phenylacetic acid degradation operon negative regulatory protein